MELQLESMYAFVSLHALKFLIALIIFFAGRFIAKRIVRIAQTLMRKSHLDETLVGFAGNILYALALAFVVIAALSQLGINTTSLAAVIAAAGLAIGLALQNSLSNLAAGVMIIVFRPFKNGDYVEAAHIAGTIEEISIFTTKMRSPDNKTIIVPNGTVIANNIVNYSSKPTRRIDLTFSVGYGDDLGKVKAVMSEIMAADKRILRDPAPVVAVLELASGAINMVCRPWVKSGDYWDVHFDLVEKMKLAFDANGISIPQSQTEIFVNMKEKAAPAAKKAPA